MDDVYLIRGDTLTDIADAIREKTGGTEDIYAGDFADEISEIETGGGLPEKGLVFEDYDSDGYPHSARLVGNWTTIEKRFLPYALGSYADNTPCGIGQKIEEFTIPEGVTIIEDSGMLLTTIHRLNLPTTLKSIGVEACENMYFLEEIRFPDGISFSNQAFRGALSLQRIFFDGDISGGFPSQCFRYRDLSPKKSRVLVDFTHCTEIPVLKASDGMEGSNGCVFRIPYALSDEALGVGNGWQSATNWVAKTYVVWEVV